MLEDWAYRYRPRPWHFFVPVAVLMLGVYLLHKGYGLLDWFFACAFAVIAVLITLWMCFAGGLAALLDYHYEMTGERITSAEDITHNSFNVQNYDKRWRTWAAQVLAGRPMAQRKWTGKGKLFGRKEYEKRLREMYRRGVVRYTNGRDENQGYMIMEGDGPKEYLRDMADGKKFLRNPKALPSPTAREPENVPTVDTHDGTHEENQDQEPMIEGAGYVDEWPNDESTQ